MVIIAMEHFVVCLPVSTAIISIYILFFEFGNDTQDFETC